MKKFLCAWMSVMCFTAGMVIHAADLIELPQVKRSGGMTLMEAMEKRSSSRDFDEKASLNRQELSDLLWCANGFNRSDKRTAPSAVNAQGIDIYVFDAEGVWLYLPKEHALKKIVQGDYREQTGMQPFVAKAAVNLVYVYDKSRWPMKGGCDGKWASADAAFCAENVYLYCASAGLKVVVRGSFPEKRLCKLLKLQKNQLIALAQSIGK